MILRLDPKGLSFELTCLHHVPEMKKALGIAGVSTEVSSWRCVADEDLGISGHQVDLVIQRRDGVINLCEMKYSSDAYSVTKKDESDWKCRISDFIKATEIHDSVQLTLVTPYGIKRNTHSWVVQKTICLDDLLE